MKLFPLRVRLPVISFSLLEFIEEIKPIKLHNLSKLENLVIVSISVSKIIAVKSPIPGIVPNKLALVA